MTADAAIAEYRELEQLYTDDPGAYRGRVRRLLWLGYGYIGLCLTIILAFVAGGVALFVTGTLRVGLLDNFLRIGIPAVAIAAMMVRAVFVRIPPPRGRRLHGDLEQAVLDWVEPVRAATGGCRVDEVLLVGEVNAAVQQRPKWGLFGPTTNSLIIGVPLLELLDEQELEAVIGHEFGHLSNAHGRMGATIYRLDHTLQHAAMAIESKASSGLAGWSFKFFRWFHPRFDKLTFAMRRGQEYEADRVSADATSAQAISASLCRLYAVNAGLSAYWDRVWSHARELPDNIRVRPHRYFADEFPRTLDAEAGRAAVRAALERETGYEDTHPCLRDRLAALEVGPVEQVLPASRALDAIFDAGQRQRLLDDLDQRWQTSTDAEWRARHEQYVEAEAELADLDARRDALDEPGLLRLARLEEALSSQDAARATIASLVERFPDSAAGLFQLGRLELAHDGDAAERAFLGCVERDPEWIPEVMPWVQHRFEEHGRAIEGSAFSPHVERYQQLVEQANAERESVSASDALELPGLSDEERARLVAFLERHPEITAFDLLEKPARFFANHRVFVMGLSLDVYHDAIGGELEAWMERVPVEISEVLPQPNDVFSVVVRKGSPWIATFEGIEGARVLTRGVPLSRRLWRWARMAYSILGLLVFVALIVFLAYAWLTGAFGD